MGDVSVYDAIGGRAAVEAAVEEFYRRVTADEHLARFFAAADMARLKAHQRAFIAAALGGPAAYAGRAMQAAHAGLSISDADFDRVAGHLAGTLAALGVPDAVAAAVLARIAPLRPEIAQPDAA